MTRPTRWRVIVTFVALNGVLRPPSIARAAGSPLHTWFRNRALRDRLTALFARAVADGSARAERHPTTLAAEMGAFLEGAHLLWHLDPDQVDLVACTVATSRGWPPGSIRMETPHDTSPDEVPRRAAHAQRPLVAGAYVPPVAGRPRRASHGPADDQRRLVQPPAHHRHAPINPLTAVGTPARTRAQPSMELASTSVNG